MLYLIEILHQTTTAVSQHTNSHKLYLIEILHQTTTFGFPCASCAGLYLIEILHQTTTLGKFLCLINSCILSKFYIKPQLECEVEPWSSVVSYRNSTSNHNPPSPTWPLLLLYLIEILHQTTTANSS